MRDPSPKPAMAVKAVNSPPPTPPSPTFQQGIDVVPSLTTSPLQPVLDVPSGLSPRQARQAVEELDCSKPHFHIMPLDGWGSDPHGPIFWKGRYHL